MGTHMLETESGGTNQDIKRIRPSEGTHSLESKSGGTSHDTERIRPSESHSPTGVEIGEGRVRTQKESYRARGTHELES